MVRHMNLEEQVDADFSRAHRRAFLRRLGARLRKDSALVTPCFGQISRALGAQGGVRRGLRVVRSTDIVGSVGRCSDFDGAFLPVRRSVGERWKKIDRAFHRGEEFPPVSLYKIGDTYFALDGNHRISVYRYHRVEWVDADVTEFRAGSRGERAGEDSTVEPVEGGPKVPGMMDLEIWKQRREELLREAERERLARASRNSRKRREAGRASVLAWELKRAAGRLLKLLRALRKAG